MISERDRFILDRIASGDENKEIAAALGVCEQTVKWHVSKMLRLFGVPNRAALVAATLRARSDSGEPGGGTSK